jgi:formyl-CoA transferase
VRSIAEALVDPQVEAREMLVRLAHPTLGEVPSIGNAMKLSADRPVYRRPPPALGEHSAEILRGLGYEPAEIARLITRENVRR